MNDLDAVLHMTEKCAALHPSCSFFLEMNQETWNALRERANLSNKFILDMSILENAKAVLGCGVEINPGIGDGIVVHVRVSQHGTEEIWSAKYHPELA